MVLRAIAPSGKNILRIYKYILRIYKYILRSCAESPSSKTIPFRINSVVSMRRFGLKKSCFPGYFSHNFTAFSTYEIDGDSY